MADIQFILRPDRPIPQVKTTMIDDYVDGKGVWDAKRIERHWERYGGGRFHSTPGSLATLHDSMNNVFTFRPTDYKTYSAAYCDKQISDTLRRQMRIAAVGGVVLLKDGTVPVQRRSDDLLVAPGMLDSSFAGVVTVKNRKLDLEDKVYEKLVHELGICRETITHLKLQGIHSSVSEMSAMFDYCVRVDLKKDDLLVNNEIISGCDFVPRERLTEYMTQHYLRTGDMISDGFAALSCVLGSKELQDILREARQTKIIESGAFENGEFIKG